ncbi:uncharacterized protein KY384_004588 [Bacidia gigantensis]|uniref:uncharacterized protein n=1 Tax=Bacidia gigantensis TaxID=2732470 RepID=UPI001D037533|nr:uncharacterized protein KY384_004588 [Bacidia gigantensis]KAG8531230.1 hypothetical protein KY384_004588 [Bacidia gigantensis]
MAQAEDCATYVKELCEILDAPNEGSVVGQLTGHLRKWQNGDSPPGALPFRHPFSAGQQLAKVSQPNVCGWKHTGIKVLGDSDAQ